MYKSGIWYNLFSDKRKEKMNNPENLNNMSSETNEESGSNSDAATEYYGEGVPEFKGDLLRKIDDARTKFEDDMSSAINSDMSEADKQASLETIRKTYLSNQGENLIEDDEAYEKWTKRIHESDNLATEIEAMHAMELIEKNGVDSGIEYIKERSKGDEAFEKSVSRTVSMFSNEKDEFSRKAFPELFEK